MPAIAAQRSMDACAFSILGKQRPGRAERERRGVISEASELANIS